LEGCPCPIQVCFDEYRREEATCNENGSCVWLEMDDKNTTSAVYYRDGKTGSSYKLLAHDDGNWVVRVKIDQLGNVVWPSNTTCEILYYFNGQNPERPRLGVNIFELNTNIEGYDVDCFTFEGGRGVDILMIEKGKVEWTDDYVLDPSGNERVIPVKLFFNGENPKKLTVGENIQITYPDSWESWMGD
jgi:hypothetical protein